MLLYCNVLRIYLTYWSITKWYVEKVYYWPRYFQNIHKQLTQNIQYSDQRMLFDILATIREKDKFMYEHINVN